MSASARASPSSSARPTAPTAACLSAPFELPLACACCGAAPETDRTVRGSAVVGRTTQTRTVKVNSTVKVGADEHVKITKGAQTTVTGAQSLSVGGKRTVEVNAVTGLTVAAKAARLRI